MTQNLKHAKAPAGHFLSDPSPGLWIGETVVNQV
uniref:Uncharacterized protein n=1 Tax=mine drainage metagenome TaxID=410659 RepID=E6QP06_9ZZZZ